MVLTDAAKPPKDEIKLRSSPDHGNKSKPSIQVIWSQQDAIRKLGEQKFEKPAYPWHLYHKAHNKGAETFKIQHIGSC